MNVFDLHCDTATELLDRYLNPISRLRSPAPVTST